MKTKTYNNLVALFALKARVSRRESKRLLNTTQDVIRSVLLDGESVVLPKLGKLAPKKVPARKGHVPMFDDKTGEHITVEVQLQEKHTVQLRTAKSLRTSLGKVATASEVR